MGNCLIRRSGGKNKLNYDTLISRTSYTDGETVTTAKDYELVVVCASAGQDNRQTYAEATVSGGTAIINRYNAKTYYGALSFLIYNNVPKGSKVYVRTDHTMGTYAYGFYK